MARRWWMYHLLVPSSLLVGGHLPGSSETPHYRWHIYCRIVILLRHHVHHPDLCVHVLTVRRCCSTAAAASQGLPQSSGTAPGCPAGHSSVIPWCGPAWRARLACWEAGCCCMAARGEAHEGLPMCLHGLMHGTTHACMASSELKSMSEV